VPMEVAQVHVFDDGDFGLCYLPVNVEVKESSAVLPSGGDSSN